jgi:hypothetical protein
MQQKTLVWAVAGALAAIAIAEARADGLEAGLWRTVQSVTINGMAGPPRESTRCLTASAVGDLDGTFSPVYGTTNSACERVEHDFSPQRLRWRLQCKGQADQDVAGEFVFERPDRYTATIHARFSMLGKLMQEVVTTIEAERVGACP